MITYKYIGGGAHLHGLPRTDLVDVQLTVAQRALMKRALELRLYVAEGESVNVAGTQTGKTRDEEEIQSNETYQAKNNSGNARRRARAVRALTEDVRSGDIPASPATPPDDSGGVQVDEGGGGGPAGGTDNSAR